MTIHASTSDRAQSTARPDGADGMAVASFVLGLLGLLAFNVVLGPFALGLGFVSLIRGTDRPARAVLGIVLGVADLLVLVTLITLNRGVLWPFGM
jgi:hypothetical protein